MADELKGKIKDIIGETDANKFAGNILSTKPELCIICNKRDAETKEGLCNICKESLEILRQEDEKLLEKINATPQIVALKTNIISQVKLEHDAYKLKHLLGSMLGIPGETLEMQQLHQCKLDRDNEIDNIKRELKWVRYGLAAIGALMGSMFGISDLFPFLLRILGL